MPPLQKQRPLRLDAAAYEKLRQEVLRRDRWTCQLCGTKQHLEVHHLRPRGRCGADIEANLLTLCAVCHSEVHNGKGAQEI